MGEGYPQFAGGAEALANPGKGSYIAPFAVQKLQRGDAVDANLRLFDINYLMQDEHSVNIKCRAFSQTQGLILAILKGLFADASSYLSGLSMLTAAQALAPKAVDALENGIIEVLKNTSTEVGSQQVILDNPMQLWKRNIPQTTWTCYKFSKFERKYPKKVPVFGSDDWNRFLILFRFVLTTGTVVPSHATVRPPGSGGF